MLFFSRNYGHIENISYIRKYRIIMLYYGKTHIFSCFGVFV